MIQNVKSHMLWSVLCVALITVAYAGSVPPKGGRMWDSQKEFGPWILHGKLLFHSPFQGAEGAYWYQSDQGKWIELQYNIKGINEFFKDEINTKESIDGFLKTQISHFLLSTMAPSDTFVVDGNTVRDVVFPRGSEAKNLSDAQKRLRSKIEGYVLKDDAIFNGDQWSLNMNVLTQNGAVERWQVVGSTAPFQILQFKRQLREKDNTFPPIVTIK